MAGLGVVALMMAALASWSVDDPSLSYATSHPASNWLGFPGAVIADLSFQILGLGVILALIPLALWSWSLLRRRVPAHMGLRFIAWIGASGLATGVLAFLPAPRTWPLPTGLGGLIGSGFANLAAAVTGDHPQPVTAWLFAIILIAPTLALFWLAIGSGRFEFGTAPAAGKTKGKGRAKGQADDETERSGILDIAIGAAVHLFFAADAALRRALARSAPMRPPGVTPRPPAGSRTAASRGSPTRPT